MKKIFALLVGIVFSVNAMEKKDAILREARNLEVQLEEMCAKDAIRDELRRLEEEKLSGGVDLKSLAEHYKSLSLKSLECLKNSRHLDIEGLVKRSQDLALRDQDSGLEKEGEMNVEYNPNTNLIMAWSERYGSKGSQTTTVIKYLATNKFEVDASVCGCAGFTRSGKANPSIVEQLKTKIAEFESTMPKK